MATRSTARLVATLAMAAALALAGTARADEVAAESPTCALMTIVDSLAEALTGSAPKVAVAGGNETAQPAPVQQAALDD